MFYKSLNDQELHKNFEQIGLQREIKNSNKVLIKINLSSSYAKNHPRTDMMLLKKLIDYIYQNDGNCALTEGSDGHLLENLHISGFRDVLHYYGIKIIDVDFEDSEEVNSYGECHYIPKCFKDYPVRISMPAASKRNNMLYSNNVKLFVGAVPRRLYQLDDSNISRITTPRPRLHQNIHNSVANLYLAIDKYSSFQFFINSGLSFNENIGEFVIPETYIGNDAVELDNHIFQTYFQDCEYPEYLNILKTRQSIDGTL